MTDKKPEESPLPPVDVTKSVTAIGLLAWLFDKAFKREAGLIIASVVVLLILGGSTVLYAQSQGGEYVNRIVGAGLKTEAEKREALEKKLDDHMVATKETNDRMEAKLDRMYSRQELLVDFVYSRSGIVPPPAPALKPADAGPFFYKVTP